jgi:CelD/BcsL family acetyltransferase involved in cellulose biosynthesis
MQAEFPLIADQDMPCPTLLIEGHEHEALRILNKSSLRRRQNGLARSGALTVRHLKRADEIEPLLDCFFDQHVRRWAPTSSPSLFVDPRNREFYRHLTRNLSSSGWLLFTVVEHDGRPIAFHYGFDRHGVVTWYKPSFDPAFASRSPGLALLRHLIEYAVTNRRRELDFSLGDEAFKSRFTNHVRRAARLHVYRDSVRYGLARAHRSFRAAAGVVFS